MQKQHANQDNTNQDSESDRESIWSIPAKWRATYFAIFTLLSSISLVVVISNQQIPPPDGRWDILIVDIMQSMSSNGVGAAITAITITEIARYIMVIAEWMLREVIEPRQRRRIERWRQEGIQEGRQEGIEQGIEQGIEKGIDRGRAEANKEWESWISRKMQAEANGETFDEPMPTHRNGTGQ